MRARTLINVALAVCCLLAARPGGPPAAAAQPAPPPPPPPAGAAAAGIDSIELRNQRAAAFNARQAAIRDSLAAEAEAWTYEHKEMTVDEQIADLNAKILREPRNAEHYNNLGVLYAERQQWLLARDAFISAVQANPLDADFHRNLALVLVQLENHELAVSEFQAYQRLDPEGGPDAWRLIGDAWRHAGDVEQARRAYLTALEKLPAQQGAERMRVVLACGQLETEGADQSGWRRLLERHAGEAQSLLGGAGDDPAAAAAAEPARLVLDNLLAIYVGDAKILLDSDLPAEAAELYGKAAALAPDREDLVVAQAAALLQAGDAAGALAAARRAQTERPRSAGGWQAEGMIAEQQGDVEAAIAAFLKARERAPQQRDLDLRIGSLYLRAGDAANARRYMGAGIDHPDTPPPVLYNYAVSLIREQKHALAIPPLRRAVQADPQMGQAWAALGLSLRATEQYAEAAEAYRRAFALAPDSKLAFNLGLSLARAGRSDAAIAAYREALALEPDFKEAQFNLGKTLLDAKRPADARVALERARQLEPDSYAVLFSLGLAHYQLGEYQRAIDFYNEALARRETADALQNMGIAYEKLGKKEEADKCYAAAKSLRGGSR